MSDPTLPGFAGSTTSSVEVMRVLHSAKRSPRRRTDRRPDVFNAGLACTAPATMASQNLTLQRTPAVRRLCRPEALPPARSNARTAPAAETCSCWPRVRRAFLDGWIHEVIDDIGEELDETRATGCVPTYTTTQPARTRVDSGALCELIVRRGHQPERSAHDSAGQQRRPQSQVLGATGRIRPTRLTAATAARAAILRLSVRGQRDRHAGCR